MQQVRPEVPPQQAKQAELRKCIRQGQHVQQVPQFSRVHMAQPAPIARQPQNFTQAQQQQQMMHEKLMQQARLMQQAGQLLQPPPKAKKSKDVIDPQKKQQVEALNKKWTDLAIHCDIDDDRVFEFWKEYCGIFLRPESTVISTKSVANGFFSYLRKTSNSGGIKHPTSQDVLDYIKISKLNKNKTDSLILNNSRSALSVIGIFFKFLKDVGIYTDDITENLHTRDIHQMYDYETSHVCRKRQNFKAIMRKYSKHTLDLNLFDQYVKSIDNTHPVIKELILQFRDYLAHKGTVRPGPDDVTKFLVNEQSLIKGRNSIHRFINHLKAFFKYTSETKAPNGQILYPDIGDCLDSAIWIEPLLKKLGDPDFQPPEAVKDIVNELIECLGLDVEEPQENGEKPSEDSLD